jgi:hypothetical protein
VAAFLPSVYIEGGSEFRTICFRGRDALPSSTSRRIHDREGKTMATDELDVPRNYGFARIGSAMNYVTRELHALKYAFDMAQLNQLGMIKPTPNVTSMQTVQSRAYSTSSQKDSSISRISGLSIRTPMTRVGLEHHTSTSNSHLDTTKGMSLTIAMAFRNYELRLADDEEKLYRCASDDFRAAIEKLSAAEGEAWLRAY